MNFNNLDELNNLSEKERNLVLKILNEYSQTGSSKNLDNLMYEDYEEIPVPVHEFLHNPIYLGKGLTNEEGKFTLFPYWEELLNKLYPNSLETATCNTLALTGSIGIGKSTEAVIIGLYELYRMLCLKNPYLHYGLMPTDLITFAVMNITMDAAKGVAWSKLQSLLQSSEWFMKKGTISKGDLPEWKPPKGIELIYGSQSRHIIGRAVYWCLDGDTVIATNLGDKKLSDLINKEIKVYNIDETGNVVLSDTCTVQPTAIETEEYEIELEDGTIIKCTPSHRFMLKDGSYKEARLLTEEDEILEFIPVGYVYKITKIKIKSIKKNILTEPKQYYDVINANPYNNFLIKTESGYVGSHNCFFDEISFMPNMDVEKQKEKAKTLINTASARMQSRFMKGDKNPTILCLASSKRTEQSFMETFIESKKKNESKSTLVIDEPQWVIRTDKQSEKTFKVAVGNKFLDSEVVPLSATEKDLQYYIDKGFTLLEVPFGYYENFIDDIDIALTDIAGISTSNLTRYLAGNRIASIKNKDLQNLFVKDIITVGNAPDDTTQYYDYIDLDRLDRKLLDRPLFIHLDMSVSGDKTGIAGVWIKGKKPHQDGQSDSKELFYTLAFSVSVKAPKGYQISFEKNRQFIRWLRDKGFAIKGVSADSFQSADLLQQLSAEDFETEIISVDRVDTASRICIPYQTLKSAIYENRLEMYEAPLLTEEFVGLERNNNGKVDHSPSGINSKDQSDAVCGALFNASKHAEEFAFFWGESIETLIEASTDNNAINTQKQIQVDMQEELNKMFNKNSSANVNTDIFGNTVDMRKLYLYNGIIV